MTEKQHQEKQQTVVIVGGVAGGASAAAKIRRQNEHIRIIMVEKGEYVSFANCGLPYHVGGQIPKRESLLITTPQGLNCLFNIDVRTGTEATKIIKDKKTIVLKKLSTGVEEEVAYDYLILSPGSKPFVPPTPGIQHPRISTLTTIPNMDKIKEFVDAEVAKKPSARRPLLVIGGGFIGIELAESVIHGKKLPCTVIELGDQIMAPLDPEMVTPLHQELSLMGIDLRLKTSVEKFEGKDDHVDVFLSNGTKLEFCAVCTAIGVRPEVTLARDAGLQIGERGGIFVDEYMQTSDPHIFAVGDAIEVKDFISGGQTMIPLAGPANKQGRLVAFNLFAPKDKRMSYKGTQGSSAVKIGGLSAAATGLNEKMLKMKKIPYEKVYTHAANHAGYYPGSSPLSLKLLFDPKDGKVLGAQCIGREGVDKRIDVIATAIRANMTVFDLEELELCYAPPFNSAKDPVNVLGFIAANILRGDVKVCHADELLELEAKPQEGKFVVDVRHPEEAKVGLLKCSINCPRDHIMESLDKIPKDKEIIVVCGSGLRSYNVCRRLSQLGYNVRNLVGGLKTLEHCKAKTDVAQWSKPYVAPKEEDDEEEKVEKVEKVQVKKSKKESTKKKPSKTNKISDSEENEKEEKEDEEKPDKEKPVKEELDARGMQCPGPILAVAGKMAKIPCGSTLKVLASDSGFVHDIPAWCKSTGNTLIETKSENGDYIAVLKKLTKSDPQTEFCCSAKKPLSKKSNANTVMTIPMEMQVSQKKKTIVVFSNQLDKVIAAFILANGSMAMGSKVTMFFTFWGLTALRKDKAPSVKKTFMEKMFGWMLPKGPGDLSQMAMGGMGNAMIKGIMKKHGVPSVEEMMKMAIDGGVRLVACSMAMELLGFKKEELIDGVEIGGAAMYLEQAEQGSVNLFIG